MIALIDRPAISIIISQNKTHCNDIWVGRFEKKIEKPEN